MPMLLEDLAEETSASNRRAADRLDTEARRLDELREAATARDEFLARAVESARQAADYALARMAEAEGVWRSALASLQKTPTGDKAERLLRIHLSVFESGRRLVRAARALWQIPEQISAAQERLDDLNRAERWFEELAEQVKQALEHRERGWQPTDPARLGLGLQLAREGKVVKEDEARRWFRKASG
jgi:hypothetical protein